MAKRTVYLRYGDKTALFKAALERAIEEWIVPIERLQAAETDDLEETLLRVGHILVANPVMCALTGRNAEDLAGRHVDLLAHPDEPPVTDLGLEPAPGEPAMDPHLLFDGERRLRRIDGGELWVVQAHEVVRHTNGSPQFVVLSLVDVTDRVGTAR